MPSSVLVIDEQCLPKEFKHVICENAINKTVVRSDLRNMEDIHKWVRLFGRNTNTQWNTRSSCPEGTRIICKKKFVCHHSSFMKIKANAKKKGGSKNTNCQASILIMVKLDTVNTRRRDEFVKKRMQGIITIYTEHNHTLHTAKPSRLLQAESKTKKAKEIFYTFFCEGMTVAESKKIYEQLINSKEDNRLLSSKESKYPTCRTIQYWYTTWRNSNVDASIQELFEEQRTTYAPDTRHGAASIAAKRTPKTGAQRARDFRERRKTVKAINISATSSPKITVVNFAEPSTSSNIERNQGIHEEDAFEHSDNSNSSSRIDFVDVKREIIDEIDIKDEPIMFDESTDSDLHAYTTQMKSHIKKENSSNCSSFEEFGVLVGVSLKQLPEELADQAQNEIENVLMKFKLLVLNTLKAA